MADADSHSFPEKSSQLHPSPMLQPEPTLAVPVLLLTEHILGSIPLWEVKGKKKADGLREKVVVREVLYRGELRKIPLVIYASGDLGLPNSVDLELFRGFERCVSGMLKRDHVLPSVIKLTGAEILQACGKELSGAAYAEIDRFFLRMAGMMISAGRTKTIQEKETGMASDSEISRSSLRMKKGIVFKIFGTVVLPGQFNEKGELAAAYEVELAGWYRESLLMGNCIVIDHSLFTEMKGSISKLLHQLLHNLFHLGKGHAEQRYTDLVGYWQITRYRTRSRVAEQFAEAHRELMTRGFLERWEIIPIEQGDEKDFVLIWEAGPAWWKTDSQLLNLRNAYAIGESYQDEVQVIDPFLTALSDPREDHGTGITVDPSSAARLLHEILEISGRRRDPAVWEKWWKRAIAVVPHPRIWMRIGEVKERKARGERINMGSYLAKLIKIEAQAFGVPWAEEAPVTPRSLKR